MACERHPSAGGYGPHCPACLLEEALAASGTGAGVGPPRGEPDAVVVDPAQLSIQLPLGRTKTASVFLVTQGTPPVRLLRLKVWRMPAAPDFPERFRRLQSQLDGWREPAVDAPLSAWVDEAGRPLVLSPFRRGVPIVDSLQSGTLEAGAARACFTGLADVIRSAHDRRLAHGSIVPGNVMVHARTAHLLDFGLAGLLGPPISVADLMAADRAGLAALARALAL